MINTLATFIGHFLIIMVGAAIACTIFAFIVIALVVGIRDILGYWNIQNFFENNINFYSYYKT